MGSVSWTRLWEKRGAGLAASLLRSGVGPRVRMQRPSLASPSQHTGPNFNSTHHGMVEPRQHTVAQEGDVQVEGGAGGVQRARQRGRQVGLGKQERREHQLQHCGGSNGGLKGEARAESVGGAGAHLCDPYPAPCLDHLGRHAPPPALRFCVQYGPSPLTIMIQGSRELQCTSNAYILWKVWQVRGVSGPV